MPDFNGLYDRGAADACPIDHFRDLLNVTFTEKGVRTRDGFNISVNTSGGSRIYVYKRIGEASRLLILKSGGRLYDSTNLTSPILTVVGMTDFAMVTLFNRAYISPSDGTAGLVGGVVYVYQGGGPSSPPRPAGGTPPSGFTLGVVNSASSGKVETGQRLYAVAFETDTGFITRPGPLAFTALTSTGGLKVDVSAIPVGPAGTISRHILCTKAIVGTYSGNQADYELFFIPNGEITNNTATTKTVDFYDSDLVRSADYLLDLLDQIPAFVGMTQYNGRLMGWGNPVSNSVLYASLSGLPESISSVDGFAIVDPGDAGGGLKNGTEFRSLFYITKDQRTYQTQDNNLPASSWKVTQVDAGIGASPRGIGRVLDSGGNTVDRVFVADRSGLLNFSGSYPDIPLSWKINDVWTRITPEHFDLVQVVIDPINKFIYCNVPLDNATTPSHILVCNYDRGLTPNKVRWSIWSLPFSPSSIIVDTASDSLKPLLTGTGANGKVHAMYFNSGNYYDTVAVQPIIVLVAIDSWVKTPLFSVSRDGNLNHFSHLRIQARGNGTFSVTAYDQDETLVLLLADIEIAAAPGKFYDRLINLTSEKCSLKLEMSAASEYFDLSALAVYGKITALARPNS